MLHKLCIDHIYNSKYNVSARVFDCFPPKMSGPSSDFLPSRLSPHAFVVVLVEAGFGTLVATGAPAAGVVAVTIPVGMPGKPPAPPAGKPVGIPGKEKPDGKPAF